MDNIFKILALALLAWNFGMNDVRAQALPQVTVTVSQSPLNRGTAYQYKVTNSSGKNIVSIFVVRLLAVFSGPLFRDAFVPP